MLWPLVKSWNRLQTFQVDIDKQGSKLLLIYTSDKTSEGSWTRKIKSILPGFKLFARGQKHKRIERHWQLFSMKIILLALLLSGFGKGLIYQLATAVVPLSDCSTDLMTVAIEGDRHMVNPITCQVFLESVCLFSKLLPNSFQGPKVGSNTIIHLESSFCLPGESNSRSLPPGTVFDLSRLFREYPAI